MKMSERSYFIFTLNTLAFSCNTFLAFSELLQIFNVFLQYFLLKPILAGIFYWNVLKLTGAKAT